MSEAAKTIQTQSDRIQELIDTVDDLTIQLEQAKVGRDFWRRRAEYRRLLMKAHERQVESERAYILFFKNKYDQLVNQLEELRSQGNNIARDDLGRVLEGMLDD